MKQLSFWGEMPAKTVVILISGKAGVGKTTSARFMHNHLATKKMRSDIRSFADGIKDCAIDYFGWDGEKDVRGRRLLQQLGTEIGREYNENVWVDHLISSIKKLSAGFAPLDYILVDDWRFPNELTRFYDFPEFQTFRVKVVSDIRGTVYGTAEDNHSSESALNGTEVDVIVYNNGTLEDLNETIKQLVERRIIQ